MTNTPARRATLRRRLGPPLAVALGLLLAGCNRPPSESPAALVKDPGPPQVTTARPAARPMNHRIDQPGEIRAFEEAPMYARVSGFVEKVSKDIGDTVAEGEVMAELAVPEMKEDLNQKEALVAQAEAEVEQARKLLAAAEADVSSAAAKVKEAEAGRVRVSAELRRAESQFERLKKSSSVLSQEQLEEMKLGVDAAKAAVAEVEAKVGSAEADRVSKLARQGKASADIRVAEAHQRVAKADERHAAEMLKYSKLRAPFAGVVTRRHVDRGHFLQAVMGKAEPAFVVAQTDPVRVFVDVPEEDAVLIRDGTLAIVSVQALKGEEFGGAVKRSAWSLDPAGGRTLRTEIDLKNPDGRLRAGMYAQAAITVHRPAALAVPALAVTTQGEQTFVFLVQDGKAVRIPVRTGFRDGQFVELVKKRTPGKDGQWVDVSGAEEVVTSNPAALTDGQAVSASGDK